MRHRFSQPISGQVFRRKGRRGAVLVREVPAARRAAGQSSHRTGMDHARPTGRGRSQLKAWMGRANTDTTMKYLHYAPRDGEADLVVDAFAQPSLDPATLTDGS
jgi:hypothetical protein